MKNIIYDLKPYTIEDYQLIVNEFTAFFSQKYSDNLSLYQFGNTSYPSVSDLDLAIVIDEKKTTPHTIQQIVDDSKIFVQSNDIRRYIFEHEILIYTHKTFSMHNYIHLTSNLHLLYGKQIERVTVTDKTVLWDLRFISYATNTLKNFERIEQKHSVGLKSVLKVLQYTYHEFRMLEENNLTNENKTKPFSEEIKQMRMQATKNWSKKTEEKLILFYHHTYQKFKKHYQHHMSELSEKIFHAKIQKSITVLENNHLEYRHLLFIELAGYYAHIFQEEKNCYANVHQKMFPLTKQTYTLNPIYGQLIRKQAQALLPACEMYHKYGATQVLGPMMCYHCSPVLSSKQKLVSLLQWPLFRLQGL